MSGIGNSVTNRLVQMLKAPDGLPSTLATLALPSIADRQIVTQNLPLEIAERAFDIRYPTIHIYCEKLANELAEKFRTFSGKAVLAIELRVSHDRVESLDYAVHSYVDALTQVLDASRGDWGNGMYYTGGYQAEFTPIKKGGRSFYQMARITLTVRVSR